MRWEYYWLSSDEVVDAADHLSLGFLPDILHLLVVLGLDGWGDFEIVDDNFLDIIHIYLEEIGCDVEYSKLFWRCSEWPWNVEGGLLSYHLIHYMIYPIEKEFIVLVINATAHSKIKKVCSQASAAWPRQPSQHATPLPVRGRTSPTGPGSVAMTPGTREEIKDKSYSLRPDNEADTPYTSY